MYHHISGELEYITSYKRKVPLENFIKKNKLSRNSIVIELNNEYYLFKKNIKAEKYEGEFLDIYKQGNKICFDTTFPCNKKDIEEHLQNQVEDIIALISKKES